MISNTADPPWSPMSIALGTSHTCHSDNFFIIWIMTIDQSGRCGKRVNLSGAHNLTCSMLVMCLLCQRYRKLALESHFWRNKTGKWKAGWAWFRKTSVSFCVNSERGDLIKNWGTLNSERHLTKLSFIFLFNYRLKFLYKLRKIVLINCFKHNMKWSSLISTWKWR